jgi:hypothetical protein
MECCTFYQNLTGNCDCGLLNRGRCQHPANLHRAPFTATRRGYAAIIHDLRYLTQSCRAALLNGSNHGQEIRCPLLRRSRSRFNACFVSPCQLLRSDLATVATELLLAASQTRFGSRRYQCSLVLCHCSEDVRRQTVQFGTED